MKNYHLYILSVLFIMIVILGCRKSQSSHRAPNHYVSSSETKVETRRERGIYEKRRANTKSLRKMEGQEIFDKYATAVFMIFTSDGTKGYQGSGFFISGDGLAVSNYHVFKGTGIGLEKIKLLGSDVVYNVSEVIAKSDDEDFILFQVDCSHTNYLPIASSKPKIGERVYAIGSPRGLENTFSSGEISQWRDTNLMQISALIDHGSSGGALINEYGEVIGITSGSFADGSQANLNYAWSIDVIKPYLK